MSEIKARIKGVEEKVKELIEEFGLPVTSWSYNSNEIKIVFDKKVVVTPEMKERLKQKIENVEAVVNG